MTPVEDTIDTLSQAVLTEARDESEKILAEARQKAEEIRREAQEQAAAARKAILERAALDAERIRSRVIATAQLQARMLQLEHREKLLDKVCDAARRQLPSVQQWSDYDQIVRELLREALHRLGAQKAQVLADEVARRVLTNGVLAEFCEEMKVELNLGPTLMSGTGLIVETEDGRLRFDNTLETRLSRLQDSLRSSVYHILMGETL